MTAAVSFEVYPHRQESWSVRSVFWDTAGLDVAPRFLSVLRLGGFTVT